MQRKWLTLLIVVATLVLGTAAVVTALKLRETQAPTAPTSKPKAADELPPNPLEVSFSVAEKITLSAKVEGPDVGAVNQSLAYTASGTGTDLAWVRIYWAKTGSDLSKSTSWTLVSETTCTSKTACSTSGTFKPATSGSYYIAVNASDKTLGACSGNPSLATTPIAGWTDCGANDLITLNIDNYPSASIEGPSSGKVNESLTYKADASATKLAWVRIYWAKKTADLTKSTSWTLIKENATCNNAATCTTQGSFASQEAGEYYITANASATGTGKTLACSGNPSLATTPIAGWTDCGANDLITLTLSGAGGATATPTPTPTPTSTATPTPTPTAGGSTATPTPTATAKAKATPTPTPAAEELPQAGINIPTAVGALGGIMLLLLGLALAL